MIVRRLNQDGCDQFRAYLKRLREAPSTPPPPELVDDPRFTRILSPPIPIEQPRLETKYHAGCYLCGLLSRLPHPLVRSDGGLWSWLSVWFFDQLCPPDGNGRRKAKDNVKYIARVGDHTFGFDRHLLFFPWKMRALHAESARFLLEKPLHQETREQKEWAGYYHNLCTPLVELCGRLYWREETQSLKRGARDSKQPGNLSRFVEVAKQLEVTYDLHGMTVDQLEQLLPKREFKRWLSRRSP